MRLSVYLGGITGLSAFGGVYGLIAYLKTLTKQEVIQFVRAGTTDKLYNIWEFSLISGRPVGKLEDITCLLTYEMLQRILADEKIPFEEKKLALERYLGKAIDQDLKHPNRRGMFLLCIINLLLFLYFTNFEGFYILLEKLRLMFKSGTLSRVMYYKILRDLKKKRATFNSRVRRISTINYYKI